MEERRRRTDRRRGERRRTVDRRASRRGRLRVPGWPEQRVQFLVRYLFTALGLYYFNVAPGPNGDWLTTGQINALFAIYIVINGFNLWDARRRPYAPLRYRFAMWLDIAMVSMAVLNDPYDIPPSLLAFIMVALGNGMRYGMRLFGEALAGSFGGAMVALSLRYAGGWGALTPGVLFLNLFGAIILVYAYMLMSRIERSRLLLEEDSRRDALTGLLNRAAFLEEAAVAFREAERLGYPLVLMFADLDRFKQVNDRYGHSAGDRVLGSVARTIQGCVRGSDLAARYGGDEFVLLLADCTLDQAERVAGRIREEVRGWSEQVGIPFDVTIGMGEAPTHGRELNALLEAVDRALYQSKSRGRTGGVERVRLPLAGTAPEATP